MKINTPQNNATISKRADNLHITGMMVALSTGRNQLALALLEGAMAFDHIPWVVSLSLSPRCALK
jgi:hypothetical protein